MLKLYRDGVIGDVNLGHDCDEPPRVGSIRLEEGVTVFLMSDGASDLFSLAWYADHQSEFSHFIEDYKKGLADRFLIQLEEARDEKTGAYLHHDNMTMIVAKLLTSIEVADNG